MKQFDLWNEKKKAIDRSNRQLFFKEREIWWCHLGTNVGVEEDGKGTQFSRPVVILRKYSRYQLFVVPLTTQIKEHPLRYNFTLQEREQGALIAHARSIDYRRLQRRIGRLPQGVFSGIKNAVKDNI